MKIWISRYELLPRTALGARVVTRAARHGAMLRVEVDGYDGFADCHPWTELGDEPLEEQLGSAFSKSPHFLIRRSLVLAGYDREARRIGQSVFAGLEIPDSHWLCADNRELSPSSFSAALARGFGTIKTKVGRRWQEEIVRLNSFANDWPVGMKLRLDCNSAFSGAEFLTGWKTLSPAIRNQIEFVEDPCPWDEREWKMLVNQGVPLAYDRPTGGPESMSADDVTVVIIKPAVQDPQIIAARYPRADLVVTSYLDHPLGQASAAFEAGRLALADDRHMRVCGLLSQNAFEPNGFSEALRANGPKFRPPEGTGFGFDELLASAKWERLT